jgi:hypothetical protein
MDPSDFETVKRAADRTILPVGLAMIVGSAATATAAFIAVLWAWDSEMPDWAFDAASLLPDPLVAAVLLLVYLWGRRRIQRRVIAAGNGERGYDLVAQAGRRGALRRYNLASALLAVALFVAAEFYLSYLGTMLYQDEDDDWDDASPTQTLTAQPAVGGAAQPALLSSSVQRSRACVSSSSICS